MMLRRSDCYNDFIARLFNNSDECMVLISFNQSYLEVIWRDTLREARG